MPGMHHACIVRSPHAAARIRSHQHQARARTCPASWPSSPARTSSDVGPVPCGASLPGLRVPHHHILAQDRVYFVGHPVAVVVATDRYIARDARRIWSKWITSRCRRSPIPRRRSRPARRAVHPEWPDNVAFTYHQEGGDVDKAFAEAEVVVKQRITSQRLIPTPMETRGVVAEWRAARKR